MKRDARAGRLALELGPPLMLGAAIAFVLAVAPVDLLESAVLRIGLPRLLPAAAPPLGLTARVAMSLAGAIGFGLASWMALRLAGRRSKAFPPAAVVPSVRRRADRHPDAPMRAPFSARAELAPAVEAERVPERAPAPWISPPDRPLSGEESVAALLARLEASLERA